jgi:predicted MFS family arabinose efflux permease
MFDNLRSRARNSGIDFRLLVPLLLNSLVVQTVVAIVRVTTSYRAVELGLSVVWLGAISAAFAILPIFMAVSVGRFIDRGNDALAAWIGSGLLAICCAGFAVWSSAEALLALTALLGIAHMFLMISQQMLCVRSGGARGMEQVVANYMVVCAVGQAIGPLIIAWVGGSATIPPTRPLFITGAIGSVIALALAFAMRPGRDRAQSEKGGPLVPVRELLRTPGLRAVLMVSVITVTAQDLIIIYLPLLGTERSIDVRDIGALLTVRAAASMIARLIYPIAIYAVGRQRLMITTPVVGALGFVGLALPLPLAPMYVAIAVIGCALGIVMTVSITSVVELSAVGARGTANSLRIMGNRVGQVAAPFGAGLVAAASGVAGILVIIAVALAASAVAVHLTGSGRS